MGVKINKTKARHLRTSPSDGDRAWTHTGECPWEQDEGLSVSEVRFLTSVVSHCPCEVPYEGGIIFFLILYRLGN